MTGDRLRQRPPGPQRPRRRSHISQRRPPRRRQPGHPRRIEHRQLPPPGACCRGGVVQIAFHRQGDHGPVPADDPCRGQHRLARPCRTDQRDRSPVALDPFRPAALGWMAFAVLGRQQRTPRRHPPQQQPPCRRHRIRYDQRAHIARPGDTGIGRDTEPRPRRRRPPSPHPHHPRAHQPDQPAGDGRARPIDDRAGQPRRVLAPRPRRITRCRHQPTRDAQPVTDPTRHPPTGNRSGQPRPRPHHHRNPDHHSTHGDEHDLAARRGRLATTRHRLRHRHPRPPRRPDRVRAAGSEIGSNSGTEPGSNSGSAVSDAPRIPTDARSNP